MLENNLVKAYSITTLLYLSLGFAYFYSNTTFISNTKNERTTPLSLNLSIFQEAQEKIEELKPEPIKLPPKTKKTIPLKAKKVKQKVIKKRQKKVLASKKQTSAGKLNKFLSQVRHKIKTNQTYPSIAKRRALQGKVKATFIVMPSGKVSQIKLKGSTLFFSATKKAIQRAFPINTRNVKVALPKEVSVTLNYQLR